MDFTNFHFWDSILFGITFYFCKCIGLLPSPTNGEDFTIDNFIQTPPETAGDFDLSQLSRLKVLVFGIFQMSAVAIWTQYFNGDSSVKQSLIVSCLVSSLMLVIAMTSRRRSTVNSIYLASRIVFISSHSMFKRVLFITATLFTPTLSVFVSAYVAHFDVMDMTQNLLSELMHLPSLLVSLLICCLCFMAERAFTNINRKLIELKRNNISIKTRDELKELMEHHEMVADLIEEISDCFSNDLFLMLTHFILQLIVQSYHISEKVVNHFYDDSNRVIFFLDVLVMVCRHYRFIMICYSSQRLSKQVELIRINLQNLKLNWLNDNNIYSMLSDFSGAAAARLPSLNAAGFTHINLPLIFRLAGTAVLYESAALQYRLKE